MACEILYSKGNIGLLTRKVKSYKMHNNWEEFLRGLSSGNFPKETRFVKSVLDDSDSVQKSILDLIQDLDTVIQALSTPKTAEFLQTLKNKLYEHLHIDLDETQVENSGEQPSEAKKEFELIDNNNANLAEHYKDLYGADSYSLIEDLEQRFQDLIVETCYWDQFAGTMTNENDLNQNIFNLKDSYFKIIVNYLKSKNPDNEYPQSMLVDGQFIGNSYYRILQEFYNTIKKIDNYKSELRNANADKLNQKTRNNKIELYKKLVKDLNQRQDFQDYIKRKRLSKEEQNKLENILYTADSYSKYYKLVSNYINKHAPELSDRLYEIQKSEQDILDAVTAYTYLQHFDQLLYKFQGDSIAIKDKNLKNIELGIVNKYTFSQDTSHQKNSWQQSENYDTSSFTANMTKSIIKQIRIYDHTNDRFMNERLNETKLITSVSNLIDDILYSVAILKNPEITNLLYQLHDDPTGIIQQVLQILFEKGEWKNIANKRNLKNYDLSVLYSLYSAIYNKNNPNSLVNIEDKYFRKGNSLVKSLLTEISAFIDRNTSVNYLVSGIDYESKSVELQIKRKFFNNQQAFKYTHNINGINSIDINRREELQNTYKFTKNPTQNNNYYVTVGNTQIQLKTKDGNLFGDFENMKLSEDFDNNILAFQNNLNDDQYKQFKEILLFIENFTGIPLITNSEFNLSVLQIYKSRDPEYLNNLLKLAFRNAYINFQFLNAGESSLKEYLEEQQDPIYADYVKGKGFGKVFSSLFNNVKYVSISQYDDIPQKLADAFMEFDGQASKATTKDSSGHNIPNNSVNKLATMTHYYLNKEKNTNVNDLLFVNNTKLIKAVYHELETSSIYGKTKSIKELNQAELFYQSIINKFWSSYIKTGNVVIQPTNYSDKTTFPNYELGTKIKIQDIEVDVMNCPIQVLLDAYRNTIGLAYKKVYKHHLDKMNKILAIYNSEYDQNETDYKVMLQKLTSQFELSRLAQKAEVEVSMDQDYRIRKNSLGQEVLTPNELLEWYANDLYDNQLEEFLEVQQQIFLDQLLQSRTAFQVLDFGDKYEYYLQDSLPEQAFSKNPVINLIKSIYKTSKDRKQFFEQWVDKNTGKLILAKQEGSDIITRLDSVNQDEAIVLNPLLLRYFYVEGLYSNNLRMSQTGFETNHPDKAFDTLYNTMKTANFEVAVNIFPELTEDQFVELQNVLQNSIYVNDLVNYPEYLEPFIQKIKFKSLTTIANVAQGTQFKRNVIIPATSQLCTQNYIYGIPDVIKVAAIMDEPAPVFNYRGDHEKDIDSADGNAKITAFQSIMENDSLGSQAVGFIKKPIWHSYDVREGTAFLAKFATTTMTNEELLQSYMSDTKLYNLLRKMTDLPWEGDVDLTQTLFKKHVDAVMQMDWFNKTILQNSTENRQNRLLYQTTFGQIKEIFSLFKEDGIYYTEEAPYVKIRTAFKELPRVYHMFNNGEHLRFNTLEEAKLYKQNNPTATTINSLFQLYNALGGVMCVDEQGNVSEFVNRVVVNLMHNIGKKKVGAGTGINQKTYDQPLKKYQIGYALNNTSLKEGAKNINPETSWSDNTQLTYFEVSTSGLGMQLNADHDIINSELTEFSQVIAATTAYGYTYDECTQIYRSLSSSAFEASKDVLIASEKMAQELDESKKEQFKSELYDAVGRIMFVNQSIKDKETLEGIIYQAVLQIFNKNLNHKEDSYKIPFSDPNIYSSFIATLASTINKESIKRKHPGSGCVMAPAYNTIQYFEVDGKKLMIDDLIKKARSEYKTYLKDILTKSNVKFGMLYSTEELINLANKSGINIVNNGSVDSLIQWYLNSRQIKQELKHKSWFQPTDVVDILYGENQVKQVRLDDLTTYYKFKDGLIDLELAYNVQIKPNWPKQGYTIIINGKEFNNNWEIFDEFEQQTLKEVIQHIKNGTTVEHVYRENVTLPRNLKPSLVRWKQEDGTYMSIFDTYAIKNPYIGKIDKSDRKAVQNVLHDIVEKGYYKDENGNINRIFELENTEAELIISNIYKDKFGVENESLSTILEQGPKYFMSKPNIPQFPNYDVVFLKDNGSSVLITLDRVTDAAVENAFQNSELYINPEDEIYLRKKNKNIFKVGKWINVNTVIYENDNFYDAETHELLDSSKYRLKDPNDKNSIQQRVDYVRRYNLTKSVKTKSGKTIFKTNTVYELANIKVFEDTLQNKDDAAKQRASIIRNIYKSQRFMFAQINPVKTYSPEKLWHLNSALGLLKSDLTIDSEVRELLVEQLKSTQPGVKPNDQYQKLKEAFLLKQANKKFASFQESLKFIASRIPAQTLQSFMAMKCVAWTKNNNNMAYVSHFQTYLQGSDYDIDKAYIMGSTYDDNGVYVGWSHLFDYSTKEALEASKNLPIPMHTQLIEDENGVKVDSYTDLINSSDNISKIKLYAELIKAIQNNKGRVSYTEKSIDIINNIQLHENAVLADSESSYKNAASSNIYKVSHDIRNRDQAYTAISLGIMKKAGNKSPKGNQSAKLNMLNPLTKYVMQYQNLVGKNVIGIAANGEKFWFNIFYHWSTTLKEGVDIDKLKFQKTFSRIFGRSDGLVQDKTITHIPDLNTRDIQIKELLLQEFQWVGEEQYAYVDQLISQLLSAATDNAKELILAKINAGTHFAKMYVYGIIMGFNINDLVAFMTSPVAEFIDSYSQENIFSETDLFANPTEAVNYAQGIISTKNFLHGSIKSTYQDINGDYITVNTTKSNYLLNLLKNYYELDDNIPNVESAIKLLIESSESLDLREIVKGENDQELHNYINFCQEIANDLKSVKLQYGDVKDFEGDISEFAKIFELSNEMSTIASAYLGLNQGLPTDEIGIISRIRSMNNLVYSREKIFGINDSELFPKEGEALEDKHIVAQQELVKKLQQNNPTLSNINYRLYSAHEKGLINQFDIEKFITDKQYQKDAIDYYGLIMGTFNGLDMVVNNPIYVNILNCFGALLTSRRELSAKARLINKILKNQYLDQNQLTKAVKYVDDKRIIDFVSTELGSLILKNTSEGFNRYFKKEDVDVIDFNTVEGLASFKYYIETSFLNHLKSELKDPNSKLYKNGLIKHLQLVPDFDKQLLATDIDLLNPNNSTASKIAYDDILRGVHDMENIDYNKQYTYADMLQLYNLIVNNNKFGSERLTTIFKVCKSPNNIINKYLQYTAKMDYFSEMDYFEKDLKIYLAPIVSPFMERFAKDNFIKVKDPIQGYILKYRTSKGDYVEEPSIIPRKSDTTIDYQALQNFYEYSVVEMPALYKHQHLYTAIAFDTDITNQTEFEQEQTIQNILDTLTNYSISNRILLYLDCK